MPELVTGLPEVGPATYSRFVLPFRYRLERMRGRLGANVPRFFRSGPGDFAVDRRLYFTPETTASLFDNAAWLTCALASGAPLASPAFQARRHGATTAFQVALSPPRIVLFDCFDGAGSRVQSHRNTMQLGFLLWDVHFPEVAAFGDLLAFNEAFRYWRSPFALHEELDRPGSLDVKAMHAASAKALDTAFGALHRGASASPYFDRWSRVLSLPVEFSGETWSLFPGAWGIAAIEAEKSSWGFQAREREENKDSKPRVQMAAPLNPSRSEDLAEARSGRADPAGWMVHQDSRAFVWTCAVAKKGWRVLEEEGKETSDETAADNPSNLGHWISLLNVDNPGATESETHAARAFQKNWTKERTYDRWLELGSTYGFTYHSGACLIPDWREPPLWRHFAGQYFDQALLLLFLRTCTFRLSLELSRETPLDARRERFHRRFSDLNWRFTRLTNLYRFPLLSNQQQAVELYHLMRREFDVESLFADIHAQVQQSEEYLNREETLNLTRLANLGLPLGIALGALSIDGIAGPLAGFFERGIAGLAPESALAWWSTYASPTREFLSTSALFLAIWGAVVGLFKFSRELRSFLNQRSTNDQ